MWAVFAKWDTFGGSREEQFVFEDNLRNCNNLCWIFEFDNDNDNGVPLSNNTLLLIFLKFYKILIPLNLNLNKTLKIVAFIANVFKFPI